MASDATGKGVLVTAPPKSKQRRTALPLRDDKTQEVPIPQRSGEGTGSAGH